MPKLGGQSTITGIDFEAWFVALKFVDSFFDEGLNIKPQASTYKNSETQETEITTIDDIYIYSDSKQEFYNLKFRAPGIRNWTINKLKHQKVLHQLKEQFIKTHTASLYFVTQSPCPIFAEILRRGASCTSRQELEINLKENKYIEEWDKLKNELGFSDDEMLKFANQVEFKHIIDTEEIKKSIVYILHGHITNLDSAPNCLHQLAMEAGKQSKTITRKDIIEYLEKNNIHLKPHLKVEELLEKVHTASASLASVPYTLNKSIHIERDEVTTLVNWIKTPLKEKDSSIAVLTGEAGCGKTVILRDLLIRLQEEQIPVLGIKSDLFAYDSITILSNEIGLSDGIKETMAAIIERYGRGVVIFDQLDALSITMAKDRKTINAYFNLISQLSLIKELRIILSCRTYDLKYDSLLISFEDKYTIHLKELNDQQVSKVLSELSIQRQQISNTLFNLLRIPLHLEVFCKIYKLNINTTLLNTLQDLYNELWNQKIIKIDDNLQNEVLNAIDAIVEEMDSAKTLTVPFALLDRNSKGRDYLLSQSILYKQNHKLQFLHSSFFDYCYARTFLAHNSSLIEKILNQHQGLFVRSQVKQVLAYLRDSNFPTYLKELKEFLTNPQVRFHIRLLIINQLSFLQNPEDEEWQIVKKILERDGNFKKHFIDGVQSEEWLKYLISNGYLQTFLQSGDEKLINLVIWKLRSLINPYTKTVIDFLGQFPNIDKKDEYIAYILNGLDHWEDVKAIQLYKSNLSTIKRWDRFYFSHFLERILKYNPEVVVEVFFNDLNEKVDIIKSTDDFDKRQFLDYHDIEVFKKLLNWNSDVVLSKALRIIHELVDKTKWGSKNGSYLDGAFYGYEQFESDLYLHWQFLSLVLEKLKTVAVNNKTQFLKLVKGFDKSCSITLLKMVLQGYNAKPELYVNEGFGFITRDGVLENMAGKYELRTFLKNIYPYFSKEQKEKTNELILSVSPEWEKHREKGHPSSIGYSKYILLNAISAEELSDYPAMKKKLLELEHKFGKYKEEPPLVSKIEWVGPPLPTVAYEKMTFEQWLSSFKKYDESTDWGMPKKDILKGGIIEHSRAFTEQVSKYPNNFYNFIFDLGKRKDISITYLAAGLDGLVKAKYDIKKVKNLVKTYWRYEDTEFRRRIIWAIDYIDNEDNLDLNLIEILKDYALNDPNPKEELWKKNADSGIPYYGGDPFTYGINTVRGAATTRLAIHGYKTQYPDKIFETLNKIADDKSIAVRCCLIKFIEGMIKWNRDKVYMLFKKASSDRHSQVIKYGLKCLEYLITENNFKDFIPYLKRVINLKEKPGLRSTGEYIGEILMLAYIRNYTGSEELLKKSFKTNEEIKLGTIQFASRHLTHSDPQIADRSRKIYMQFINEDSDEMSQKYDWCFNNFKVEDFNKIYDLILKYSKSRVIKKHCEHFFRFLLKVVSYEPGKCIDLMQNYKNFEKPDIRYNALEGEPIQILIEAYNKIINDKYKEMAMDIFDLILQEQTYKKEALKVLSEQDRE
ncbi:MAG: ATP-binding protein [Candidatus Humimicrobiia bacterium]